MPSPLGIQNEVRSGPCPQRGNSLFGHIYLTWAKFCVSFSVEYMRRKSVYIHTYMYVCRYIYVYTHMPKNAQTTAQLHSYHMLVK